MDPKGVQKKSDESGKDPMGSNSSKVGGQIYSIEVKWVKTVLMMSNFVNYLQASNFSPVFNIPLL